MKHAEIESLLPWYANGTLAARERRRVEDHLAACARCRDGLAALAALRAAVAEVDPGEPQPSRDLLARAHARIAAEEAASARRRGGRAAFLERWAEAWAAFWGPLAPPVRVALAVQLALVLALGASLLVARRDATGPWTTASDPAAVAPAGGARLVVAFEPAATEEAVRRTLLAAGASLAGGPSAAGFYTVELAVGPERRDEVERALATLRAADGVVRYAELQR